MLKVYLRYTRYALTAVGHRWLWHGQKLTVVYTAVAWKPGMVLTPSAGTNFRGSTCTSSNESTSACLMGMLITAVAQLRFTTSLLFGRPFAAWTLERLIDALQETQHEFGTMGTTGVDQLNGLVLDEHEQKEMHLRRLRTLAGQAAQETDYYRRLFAQLDLDPARLTYPEFASLPITPKAAVRETPDAFVRSTARPVFRTTTTGTTGKPTAICFSAQEMKTYIALSAIGLLARGEVTAETIVQSSTSARATLGNSCFSPRVRTGRRLVVSDGPGRTGTRAGAFERAPQPARQEATRQLSQHLCFLFGATGRNRASRRVSPG